MFMRMRRALASLLSLAVLSSAWPNAAWAAHFRPIPASSRPAPVAASAMSASRASASAFAPAIGALAPPSASFAVPSAVAVPAAASAEGAAAARALSAQPARSAVAALPEISRSLAEAAANGSASAAVESGHRSFQASVRRDDAAEAVVPAERKTPDPRLSPSAQSSKPAAWWRRAVPELPRESRGLALGAFAMSFLIIAAYSIIDPARSGLLISKFPASVMAWINIGDAALTGAVFYVYNRFTGLPRRALIGGSLAILGVTLFAGAGAVWLTASPAVTFGYFLWSNVFGIMAVTLFWTYANDALKGKGKDVFAFLAIAAPLGSLLGAFAAKGLLSGAYQSWAAGVGGALGPLLAGLGTPAGLLFLAAAVFALALPLYYLMERRDSGGGDAHAAPRAKSLREVLGMILDSRLLSALAWLVALERLVPDLGRFLTASVVKGALGGDGAAAARFFADVAVYSSVGSVLASVLLVPLLMRRFGTAGALIVTGVVNLALMGLIPIYPLLGLTAIVSALNFAGAFSALDGISRYTFFRTGKETVYSAQSKDVIFNVKALVEMVVYRSARALAGFIILAAEFAPAWLAFGGLSPAAIAVAATGALLALAWIYYARRTAAEHETPAAKAP